MNPNSYTHIINHKRTCTLVHSQLTSPVTFFFFNYFLGSEAFLGSEDYISHPWNEAIFVDFF